MMTDDQANTHDGVVNKQPGQENRASETQGLLTGKEKVESQETTKGWAGVVNFFCNVESKSEKNVSYADALILR